MISVLTLVSQIINLYMWVVIIGIVLSWLVAFNILNMRQPLVQKIIYFVKEMTEPIYQRIRRILPSLSGIDLAPLVLILALMFLRNIIGEYAAGHPY